MQLGLSENLSALVARRFKTAKEAGHLIFSPTHLSIINAGIPYQLRYCPALAKKPNSLKPSGPKPPKADPFENPSSDLLIATIPQSNPSHALVMNKFPVIPNHFILATTEWKPQTDLLEPADLEATYECLRSWAQDHDPNSRLFAFFNSGSDSGASQPHRHLQFLPIEAMRADLDTQTWAPLIDGFAGTPQTPFQHLHHLPFAHFALPLPPNPSPETLHGIYISLYRAAVSATGTDHAATSGPASISYNLAMTLSTMMIVPRRAETATVPVDVDAGDIVDPGVISLNGTILAGTLMVKAEAEWDVLRARPELLVNALREVGFPREREGMASL